MRVDTLRRVDEAGAVRLCSTIKEGPEEIGGASTSPIERKEVRPLCWSADEIRVLTGEIH